MGNLKRGLELLADQIKSHYLIIGAGISGIAAAEAVRGCDQQNSLLIINGENVLPYCRPLIADVLKDEKTFSEIHIREQDWYIDNNINLLSGDPAISINPDSRSVTLNSGQQITYEKLLIATGSQPVIPPINGLDKIPSFTLFREDDIELLKSKCIPGSKALLIGVGLIGLQAITSLKELGVDIVAVELMPKILPLILDVHAAGIAQSRLESHGIEVRTGTGIAEVNISTGNGRYFSALTDKGDEIGFDFVIIATGMRPNLSVLNGSGIETDRGIRVSDKMETNVPGIYAAGDVTVSENFIEGKPEIHAHWVNAFHQGRIAGLSMAGSVSEPYVPLYLNSLDIFGLPIITIGASRIDEPSGSRVFLSENPDRPSYKRMLVRDGKITAATFINDIELAGVIQYLIREKVHVGDVAESLFDEDLSGLEFIYRQHDEKFRSDKIGWPESMSQIKLYKKDHKHTRWGDKGKSE